MSRPSRFSKCVVDFIGSFLLGCVAGFRPGPESVSADMVSVIYMVFNISEFQYKPALALKFFIRVCTTVP